MLQWKILCWVSVYFIAYISAGFLEYWQWFLCSHKGEEVATEEIVGLKKQYKLWMLFFWIILFLFKVFDFWHKSFYWQWACPFNSGDWMNILVRCKVVHSNSLTCLFLTKIFLYLKHICVTLWPNEATH